MRLEPEKLKAGLEGILAKSSRLIARRGFRGTSMRDLALATDRSLAGLYHYFKNKEDLLFLINHRGFSSLLEASEKIVSGKEIPERKLRLFIENHICYFSSHLDEMKVMMFGTHELDSRRGALVRKLKDDYARAGRNIVAEYLAEQGGDPSDAAVTRKTYLLFGMMNWIFGWYSPQKHGTVTDLIDDIYETFTRGGTSAAIQKNRKGARK